MKFYEMMCYTSKATNKQNFKYLMNPKLQNSLVKDGSFPKKAENYSIFRCKRERGGKNRTYWQGME